MFPAMLLPDPVGLEVQSVSADEAQSAIVVNLIAHQPAAPCPLCQQVSDQVHSHYQRTLADLPWAAWRVTLHVQVRRFFCHTADCPRQIYTERLPQVAAPWARRTVRLADVQRDMGLAVGASMGSRLTAALNMPASVEVVLCLVRRADIAVSQPVRVLGVDDWAIRRGHTYGTILIDLEKGEPIEVLPDRRAETLAAWLRQHPEVEIISRDRAGAYAEGSAAGAPNAMQVADRWHLLHNLGDALVQVLEKYQRPLKQLAQTPAASETSAAPMPPPPMKVESAEADRPDLDKKPRPGILERQQQHRAERVARFEEVRALAAQGATVSAIAQKTGLDRKTVRKFIRADTFPERQAGSKRPSILDPYKPYLCQRWQEGCRTAVKLWRELQAQGYRGGRQLVVSFVAQLRQADGLPPRTRMLIPPNVPSSRLTPRTAAWLILKRPDQLEDPDRALIQRVRALHPQLEAAISLAQDFATLIRTHLVEDFDPWLTRATQSSVTALRNFAAGIQRDYAAVKAAVSTHWSNGPVEGQVNRLKFIKRQMFGRAHFDLLRKRVLYTG